MTIIDMFAISFYIIFSIFIALFSIFYKLYKCWCNKNDLLKCRYHFDRPGVGQYTFKGKKVFVIDNISLATKAGNILCQKKILYVDCEGQRFGSRDSFLCVVQIATSKSCCYIFDVITCPESLSVLKELFESKDILKIFHDCSGDIAALQATSVTADDVEEGRNGIYTTNVGDTQIASKVMCDQYYSLDNLYTIYNRGQNFPKVHVPSYDTENKWLYHRPLTEEMIKYAAIDVLVMPDIYQQQIKKISKSRLISVYKAAVMKRKVCKTRRFALYKGSHDLLFNAKCEIL